MAITTTDNYMEYTGVDLNAELSAILTDDVGDQNPAPRFIKSVESWCREYLCDEYNNTIDIINDSYSMNDTQKAAFIEGVCYQIAYVLRSGNLSNESGFRPEAGIIITREQLDKISIGPMALKAFRRAGLANKKKYI